jgi:hypothetical protein
MSGARKFTARIDRASCLLRLFRIVIKAGPMKKVRPYAF